MATKQEANWITLQVLNMFLTWNISWNGKSFNEYHIDYGQAGPTIFLSWFSLQLLGQQSLLPAQHFWVHSAFLGFNCNTCRFPKSCASLMLTYAVQKERGKSNQTNGKGIKKLHYQNFSRCVTLKHRTEVKFHLWWRYYVYYPLCYYLKCSLWYSCYLVPAKISSLMKSMIWGQERRDITIACVFHIQTCIATFFFNAFCLNSRISPSVGAFTAIQWKFSMEIQ